MPKGEIKSFNVCVTHESKFGSNNFANKKFEKSREKN